MDKISKSLLIVLSILFSLNMSAQITEQKKYVELIIADNWTPDSLETAKTRLKKAYNIDLYFKDVNIREDGSIQNLFIEVNCNDGYRGSAHMSKELREHFGFKRDYKVFAATTFAVGYLNLL